VGTATAIVAAVVPLTIPVCVPIAAVMFAGAGGMFQSSMGECAVPDVNDNHSHSEQEQEREHEPDHIVPDRVSAGPQTVYNVHLYESEVVFRARGGSTGSTGDAVEHNPAEGAMYEMIRGRRAYLDRV